MNELINIDEEFVEITSSQLLANMGRRKAGMTGAGAGGKRSKKQEALDLAAGPSQVDGKVIISILVVPLDTAVTSLSCLVRA